MSDELIERRTLRGKLQTESHYNLPPVPDLDDDEEDQPPADPTRERLPAVGMEKLPFDVIDDKAPDDESPAPSSQPVDASTHDSLMKLPKIYVGDEEDEDAPPTEPESGPRVTLPEGMLTPEDVRPVDEEAQPSPPMEARLTPEISRPVDDDRPSPPSKESSLTSEVVRPVDPDRPRTPPEGMLTPEVVRPVDDDSDEVDGQIDVEWVVQVGQRHQVDDAFRSLGDKPTDPPTLTERTEVFLEKVGVGMDARLFLGLMTAVIFIGLIGGLVLVIGLLRDAVGPPETIIGDQPTPNPRTTDGDPTLIPTSLPDFRRGRVAFAADTDGDFDLYILDMTTNRITALTDNEHADRSPSWSPDGSQLVYVSDQDGNDDLYLINDDGSDPTPLTGDPANDRFPAWSPNGDWIAFVRETADSSRLMLMDTSCLPDLIDCEASLQAIVSDNYSLHPRWNPDSDQIAFTFQEFPGLPSSIARVAPDGSGLGLYGGTGASDFFPTWSPDGQRLAFVTNALGDHDILMMNIGGDSAVQMTGPGGDDVEPVWSPDGQYILFASDRSGNSGFDLYLLAVECVRNEQGCVEEPDRLTDGLADELNPAWTDTP